MASWKNCRNPNCPPPLLSHFLRNFSVLILCIACQEIQKTHGQEMTFCPGAASVSCPALTQPVVWTGTVFSGQCPNNSDAFVLRDLTAANVGDVFTCGRYNVTVVDVILSVPNPVSVLQVSSQLSFTADSSLNGLSVMCGTASNPPTITVDVTVPGIPTPNVSTLRNSLTSITVTHVVGDDTCASTYISEVSPAGGSSMIVTSPTPSVTVNNLDLCRNRYSLVGLIEAPTGSQGSRSSPVDIESGIEGVANVKVQRQPGLEWTQLPDSLLPECITGYHISWPGGEFTTTDTSTSLREIPGFPYCQTVSVTVAPNTPNGVFTDGSNNSMGQIDNPAYIVPALDASFSIREDNDIALSVTLQETFTPGLPATRMYGVVREGVDCEPVNTYSADFTVVFNETQSGDQFIVCFLYQRFGCMDTLFINRTVTEILLSSPMARVMGNTLRITMSLPDSDDLPAPPSQLSILSTITPPDAAPVLVVYPDDRNEYSVTFTISLETSYTYTIRLVDRNNSSITYGLPIVGEAISSGCGTMCTVGIIVGVILLIIIIIIVVTSVSVVYRWKKNRECKSKNDVEEQDLTQKAPQPDSLYADPNAIEHTTAPGSEAQYAMVDRGVKEKKKKKPTQQEALYQDPVTIEHETTATGAEYAVVDKPKRASKKNQGPDVVPPGTNEGGLTYADIDVSNKSRAPRSSQRQAQEPVGSVEYSTISTENATMM